MKRPKTYFDVLMKNDKFREAFEKEYSKIVISEKIAKLRKEANLTQEALAKKIHTTKSAISRYESASYSGYTVSLLEKIAYACGAKMDINFKRPIHV
ncbi:MAG: helix-turn-helix transcriptional regulator [Candidatus Omnitrophica bacterium]|nr:helix-turn-helix transcriptional regulator [Candidatus Omnitrophota bacterium]